MSSNGQYIFFIKKMSAYKSVVLLLVLMTLFGCSKKDADSSEDTLKPLRKISVADLDIDYNETSVRTDYGYARGDVVTVSATVVEDELEEGTKYQIRVTDSDLGIESSDAFIDINFIFADFPE